MHIDGDTMSSDRFIVQSSYDEYYWIHIVPEFPAEDRAIRC
jgi:hypothetical protein